LGACSEVITIQTKGTIVVKAMAISTA